jgi:hypothetical protein
MTELNPYAAFMIELQAINANSKQMREDMQIIQLAIITPEKMELVVRDGVKRGIEDHKEGCLAMAERDEKNKTIEFLKRMAWIAVGGWGLAMAGIGLWAATHY